MKKLYITSLLLVFFSIVKAQETDTLLVSDSKRTYLVLPEEITFVDLQDTTQFALIIDGKSVVFQAYSAQSKNVEGLVKYGDEFHPILLKYAANPPKTFNRRGGASVQTTTKVQAVATEEVEKPKAKKEDVIVFGRIRQLDSLKRDDYKSIAQIKNKIKFKLSNLYADDDYLYVKLQLGNDSKSKYIIDFPEFVYEDPQGKIISKKNVLPSASNQIVEILGGGQEYLIYVIPRFVISKKGWLTVVIREKTGLRILELEVPYDALIEAKTFKKNN